MSNVDIIRAWKDEQYRNTLNENEQALLPENPAGQIELDDSELGEVEGGSTLACIGISIATIQLTVDVCTSFIQRGTCQFNTSGCC